MEEAAALRTSTSMQFNRVFLRGKWRRPYKPLRMKKSRSWCRHTNNTSTDFFTRISHGILPQSLSGQDEFTKEVTWLSIDGLLDSATSTGSLEHLEEAVWGSFSPLQIVLLLAIAAAAVGTSRQHNLKELQRLQAAIDSRDRELVSLHERIKCLQEHLSFWKEYGRPLCGHVQSVEARATPLVDKFLSPSRLELESTPKCSPEAMSEFATPCFNEGCNWRQGFSEMLVNEGSRKRCSLEGVSNSGDLFEQLANTIYIHNFSDLCPAQLPIHNFSDICTPQLPHALLSNCHTSGFCELCHSQDCECLPCQQEGHRCVNPNNVLSTTAVSFIKIQLQQLLQIEAPDLITTLSLVMEQAKNVEKLDPVDAKADLRKSVKQGSAQIETLRNIWNSIEEEVVDKDATHTGPDECFNMLNRQLDMEEQIKREDLCKSIDAEERRLSGMSDWSNDTCSSDASYAENNPDAVKDVASAFEFAVKKTVDDIMGVSGRSQEFNSSPEMVIEMLLVELENAASKVANMEIQISTLREALKLSEKKKEEAEQRFLELQDRPFDEEEKVLQVDQLACQEAESYKLLQTSKEFKDQKIARLEEEITLLQARLEELTAPKLSLFDDANIHHSPPTFLTTNLLFNSDSPVKSDSPESMDTETLLWRLSVETSRVGNSLDAKAAVEKQGSCSHYLDCDNSKHEQRVEAPVVSNENINKGTERSRTVSSSNEDHTRPKATNTYQHYETLQHQPARKLKFPSATRLSEATRSRQWSLDDSSKMGRQEFSSNAKVSEGTQSRLWLADDSSKAGRQEVKGSSSGSCSILAGVEPNTTTINAKAKRSGTKERDLSRSVDSLSKSKENFFHRPRWM